MGIREKLSLRRLLVINSICIGILLCIGCVLILLDIQSAYLYNLDNIEKMRNSALQTTIVTDVNAQMKEQSSRAREVPPSTTDASLTVNSETVANAEALSALIVKARNKTLITLGLVILLACMLQGIVLLLLRHRMKSSLTVIDLLSKGDLTARFNDSIYDEIGKILTGFNSFIDNIVDMISTVVKNALVLADASRQLSGVSTSLEKKAEQMALLSEKAANSSGEMSNNLGSIASTSEEMSANTNSTSSTIEEMSTNMNLIASSIVKMSASIGDIADNAREGAAISNEAMEMSKRVYSTMNNLGETAQAIGNVTETIRKITSRTNLLALNASIEAASAGDAGKGFAVVANEIKELAAQSARAAKEIADQIASVQKSSQEAVDVIGEVTNTINRISESSGKIAFAVEEQTLTANEISTNVGQITTGSINIAQAVAELAKGINDLSAHSHEVAQGANLVSQNTQNVTKSAIESNADAHIVNESAQKLAALSERLLILVDRFSLGKQKEHPHSVQSDGSGWE